MAYTVNNIDQERKDFQVATMNAQIETNILESYVETQVTVVKSYTFEVDVKGTLEQSAINTIISTHKAKGWTSCTYTHNESTQKVRFVFTRSIGTPDPDEGGGAEGNPNPNVPETGWGEGEDGNGNQEW